MSDEPVVRVEGLRKAYGSVMAVDSPENLVRRLGAENRVEFAAEGFLEAERLQRLPGVARVETVGERTMVCGRGDGLVVEVVNALAASGVRFRDLRTEQATLEDVFLALTGRQMRD